MEAEVRANRSVLRRLGKDVVITPQGGTAYPCLGLYELERGDGSGPGTTGRPDPQVSVEDAEDLPELSRGDHVAVKVHGKWREFALVRPEPDDTGMINLTLREQH